jgi:hypothetical protein
MGAAFRRYRKRLRVLPVLEKGDIRVFDHEHLLRHLEVLNAICEVWETSKLAIGRAALARVRFTEMRRVGRCPTTQIV